MFIELQEYYYRGGGYNLGTFTLLVDADGKPLLWEGGEQNADEQKRNGTENENKHFTG